MASKALPSPEVLRQLLRYEPETGKLFWLPRGQEWFGGQGNRQGYSNQWNSRYGGKEAFTSTSSSGHRMGIILGVGASAHRVIWAMQTGAWPDRQIDHIDTDANNNRWGNLRAASHSENMRNKGVTSNNTSGVKGVSWHKASRMWRARITLDRKQYCVGSFQNIDDAARAIEAARPDFHGTFSRQR